MIEGESRIEEIVLRPDDEKYAPMKKELHMNIIGDNLFLTIMEEQDAKWVEGKCIQSFKEIEDIVINVRVFKAALDVLAVKP